VIREEREMSHGPIEEKHYETMRAVADALNEFFAGYGFVLLVFEMTNPGEMPKEDARMNYVSNSRRDDVLAAMKEFIANAEGRVVDAPRSKQ
jgi:hypothetical protein